jgi:nitrite reductase (NO-forming)
MKKLTICILATLSIFFVCTAFQDYNLSASVKRGKEVYVSNCQNCHLENGSATTDRCPPLAKADYLRKPVDSLIIIILEGQRGEIVVNGKKYNEEMLAQNYLSDAEIADVLNFVRNSWGNKMAVIRPQRVKTLRK